MTKRILGTLVLLGALAFGAQAQQIGLPGVLPFDVATGTVQMATSTADITYSAEPALYDTFIVQAIAFEAIDNATWTLATFAGGVSAATGVELRLRKGTATVRASLTGSNRINTTNEWLRLGAEVTFLGDQTANQNGAGTTNRAAQITIPCDRLFAWRQPNGTMAPGLRLEGGRDTPYTDHVDVLIDDDISALVSFTGSLIGYYLNEK